MSQFKIQLSSVPDRENLVAEIWYREILVAEINQEAEKLDIEFYVNEKMKFDLDEFLKAVENAKGKIREE
ncbi:hypothetical protein ACR78Z_05265 [Sphingobacterium thalpophilum]|uniref:Uncharacterized protein n=1 Tax=Sphingobacterium thalpophilum TaxID=259 RepID=A0A4U9W286_9SPHI|nr:hypothetical protein [Sphingobacterium thalpophilum]VTR52753.1 Uncharacterised protein [Sphingobacterium thalpophilum]